MKLNRLHRCIFLPQLIKSISHLIIYIQILCLVSCANSNQFSGSAEKKKTSREQSENITKSANNKPTKSSNSPQESGESFTGSDSKTAESIEDTPGTNDHGTQEKGALPPGELGKCDQSKGITVANLLTPVVNLSVKTAEIVYELKIENCSGQSRAIEAESIAFDFDGSLDQSAGQRSLSYKIVAGSIKHEGTFVDQRGQDLFGNRGDNYFYFETAQKVSTTTNSQNVRLAILVGGLPISPRDTSSIKSTGEFTLPTFLRFGSSAPVSKPIRFQNAP